MNRKQLLPLFAFVAMALMLGPASAAENTGWAGEYADKKFLNGQATFQLSIEQSGGITQVSFDAVNNNGQGCAPEAQGRARVVGKDRLQFPFTDNRGNSGSGTISRSGADLIVSLKLTRTANRDCAKFYVENIRVKAVGK